MLFGTIFCFCFRYLRFTDDGEEKNILEWRPIDVNFEKMRTPTHTYFSLKAKFKRTVIIMFKANDFSYIFHILFLVYFIISLYILFFPVLFIIIILQYSGIMIPFFLVSSWMNDWLTGWLPICFPFSFWFLHFDSIRHHSNNNNNNKKRANSKNEKKESSFLFLFFFLLAIFCP